MKKSLKLLSLVCAVSLLAGALASCGAKKEESKGEEPTYTVITETTFAPFDTVDEQGNIVGFDMDLIKAIGENQGFKVQFKNMEFDSLIPALQSGNGDIIAAGMNKDDAERGKKVDFSDKYYQSGLVVMVKDDNSKIKSIDDLTPEMVVSSQIGTTGGDLATKLKDEKKVKDAKINNEFTQCILQVKNGDVDAAIIDKPVAEQAISKTPGLKIVGETMNAESFGFAVKKGNKELLEKINKGLENLVKDGEFQKIYDKWFGKENK